MGVSRALSLATIKDDDAPAAMIALIFPSARDPSTVLKNQLTEGSAQGQLIVPRAVHPPRKGEDLGPRALFGAHAAVPIHALRQIKGTLASVSTLLTTVGLPNRPKAGGKGGRRRGCPSLPSIEFQHGSLFTADIGARTQMGVNVQGIVAAKQILPQQPGRIQLGDLAFRLAAICQNSPRK